MINIEDQEYFNFQEKRILKTILPKKGLMFSRYFFKERETENFIVSGHHNIMSDTLQKVFDGEIKRLIINIPPSYTKTEEAVIHFITRGLAINPRAKFIHSTYSQDLALLNSSICRDIIESEQFQELFPMQIRKDSKSKKRWFNEFGGGVYAVSTQGAVTGFRAGRMGKGFTGALIIDDPIKPDDAYSDVKRTAANNRFNNTLKSRLALESTPIIVIMQRLHEDDYSGFLLKGGSGEKWHHLLLPAIIPEESILDTYPVDYTHGIPIDYNLKEGALWEAKHTLKDLQIMEKADPYTNASQYMQRPAPKGGAIFKDEYWKLFTTLPMDCTHMRIYGDTAQETKTHNDFSVFQCWVFSPSKGIFLIDQVRGKWETPELKTQFIAFWNKQKQFAIENLITLQVAKIEKKSSGSGLFQTIRREKLIPVIGIDRSRGKIPRAFDVLPHIVSGNVWLLETADWLFELINEHRKFTPLLNHKHDDQIDPLMDAITDLLIDNEYIGEIKTQGR